jgi:hypothetical protein
MGQRKLLPLVWHFAYLGLKLLMKKIDVKLRGAISCMDFIGYFDPKIKKFKEK